ncbi:hypothetical protein SO694_00144071 [Aureococcus anophagefferens]|uniref:Uncharacterized protein n=1 Tax=Aureococcus anophagefferens TaxID=44056 RepID=A0ABR1FPR8_AURAN
MAALEASLGALTVESDDAPPSPPKPPPSLRKFAILATRAKMHAKALELWRRLAAADPDDCVAWYNVGGAAAGLGDVDGALEAYARALAPHCGAALRRRRRRRPRRAALADFDAAPGGDFPAHALYNLNTALRQVGDQRAPSPTRGAALSARAGSALRAAFAAARAAGARARPRAPVAAADDTLTVACVKWGTKYDAGYANTLARAVRRHLAVGAVVCYTDDPSGLDADVVEARPLPAGTALEAWWLKAYLFSADAGLEGRVLYVDLDTVVCGPLAGLAAYGGDSVALLGTDDLANENRSGGYNSSLMVWTAPALSEIYDLVAEPGAYAALSSCVYKFDHWLEMLLDDGVPLQDLAPGLVAEYARDVLANGGAPPPGASIVCFPLEPKPHDVATPWVAAHWR